MALTSDQIQTLIDANLAMQAKVLGGATEYSVGSRRVRYPSLAELQNSLEALHTLQGNLSSNSGRMSSVGRMVPPR